MYLVTGRYIPACCQNRLALQQLFAKALELLRVAKGHRVIVFVDEAHSAYQRSLFLFGVSHVLFVESRTKISLIFALLQEGLLKGKSTIRVLLMLPVALRGNLCMLSTPIPSTEITSDGQWLGRNALRLRLSMSVVPYSASIDS